MKKSRPFLVKNRKAAPKQLSRLRQTHLTSCYGGFPSEDLFDLSHTTLHFFFFNRFIDKKMELKSTTLIRFAF